MSASLLFIFATISRFNSCSFHR